MSFRLVPNSVTLNDLERQLHCVISLNLLKLCSNTWTHRSVAEFMHYSITFCSAPIRCRRKESSRSLSHLLMIFLLANVYVRYISSFVRRLSSVKFMHPTQAIEIFGNISTLFGTLAICWHPGKILRRSSQGKPSVGGVNIKIYLAVDKYVMIKW